DDAVLDGGPAGNVIDSRQRRIAADGGERVRPEAGAVGRQIGDQLSGRIGHRQDVVGDSRAGRGKNARRLGNRLVAPDDLAGPDVDRIELVVAGGDEGAVSKDG